MPQKIRRKRAIKEIEKTKNKQQKFLQIRAFQI